MELCKCGCGREVRKGNLYVHGHNRRGLASHTSGKKWSMNYDCCCSCGGTEYKHQGNGLCTICYVRKRYILKKANTGRWAINYECCIDCGRTDRPHKARGFCGTCYTNYLNRQKGIKKRNFGQWSWYYDECQNCGTTERPHAKDGLCRDCYEMLKRNFSDGYEICPVCGVKVIRLNQHISMRAKRCKDHEKYQYDLFEMYFKSDLGLDDIAKELNTDRHIVSNTFIKFFGRKKTFKRNEEIKRCLISEYAVLNYNPKNKYGTVVYYDSLNNGKVRFRSKLEKQFAKFLDRSGVKWVYENKAFPYIDAKGKRRTYTPDFYFVDEDRYIEIKGYRKSDDDYKVNKLKGIGINIKMIRKNEFDLALKKED